MVINFASSLLLEGYNDFSFFNALVLLSMLDVCALQIQRRMEEMAGSGLDTNALDDESFNMEAAQDRCILRLIASCCNGEFAQSN